jgi:hypothetical protein
MFLATVTQFWFPDFAASTESSNFSSHVHASKAEAGRRRWRGLREEVGVEGREGPEADIVAGLREEDMNATEEDIITFAVNDATLFLSSCCCVWAGAV